MNKINWTDARIGDSALVTSENKMGVILKDYGRKFHLRFADGSEKTYDASELNFFNTDDDYKRGGSIKKGDVYQWNTVEYDSKKGNNYKVVKNIEITDIDSKGQVIGRVVGTSNQFIIRDPQKNLKSKVSKMETGGDIERGGAHMYIELKDSDIVVYHGDAFKIYKNAKPMFVISSAKKGSWDELWQSIRSIQSSNTDGQKGSAHLYVKLSNGDITVYHGDDVRQFRKLDEDERLFLQKNVRKDSWDRVYNTLMNLKSVKMENGGGIDAIQVGDYVHINQSAAKISEDLGNYVIITSVIGRNIQGKNYPYMFKVSKNKLMPHSSGKGWKVEGKINPIKPQMFDDRKMQDGGVVGQEIVFDDSGERNTGVIKEIHEITGDYIVATDDGRTVLAQKEFDVISLGKMRKQAEAKRRFSFFEDGGNIAKENKEMIDSQTIEARHHVEELSKILTKKNKIEPWVVARMERATTDLSDVTHYLEGKKMATGGGVGDDFVIFSIDDDALDTLLFDNHRSEIDYEDIHGDSYYKLNRRDFDRFIDYADSIGFDVDYENNEDSVVYVVNPRMSEGGGVGVEKLKIGQYVRYKKGDGFTGGKIKSITGNKAEVHNWDGSTIELSLNDLEYVPSWNNKMAKGGGVDDRNNLTLMDSCTITVEGNIKTQPKDVDRWSDSYEPVYQNDLIELRVYESALRVGAYDVLIMSRNKYWWEFTPRDMRKRSKPYVNELRSQITSLLKQDGIKLKSLKMMSNRVSMETGGGVGSKLKATYIPNRNIDELKTVFGQSIKGKDLIDGAYTTRKGIKQKPKMARTMFEEETYEFSKGGGVKNFELDKRLAEITLKVLESKNLPFGEEVYMNLMDRDLIKSMYGERLPRGFAGPTSYMLIGAVLNPLTGKSVYMDGSQLIVGNDAVMTIKYGTTTWKDVIEKLHLQSSKMKRGGGVSSNWDKLNKIAEDKYGEYGFATLDEDEMSKFINIKKANKIAEDEFGEFGFATLDEDEMKQVINNNPSLIIKKMSTGGAVKKNGVNQFAEDEKSEGYEAKVFLGKFDGRTFKAQSTDKTWDDGTPVTKYFSRNGFKDVKLKGEYQLVDSDRGWWYIQGPRNVWYAVRHKDYGTPPFEFGKGGMMPGWKHKMAQGGGVDAKGKLSEQEQVDKLQKQLGVKVAPSQFGKDNYTIYPDSEINDKYYDGRSAQTITIKAEGKKYYFSTAGGYRRSIQPIAKYLGAQLRENTGIAGRAAVDLSLNKTSLSIKELKQFVNIIQQGLKAESNAFSNFYKNWSNPD